MQHEIKKQNGAAGRSIMINLHPNWCEFIRQCELLGYGEIFRLKIQDGLPMAAETVKQRVQFSKKSSRPVS
jgi:hypothetical protein